MNCNGLGDCALPYNAIAELDTQQCFDYGNCFVVAERWETGT